MGTAALIIEGTKQGKHTISSRSATSGHQEYKESCRSKLSGLIHSISILEYIYKPYNLTKGATTAACDGIEATNKAMDIETQLS